MSNKACVPDVDTVVLAGGKGSRLREVYPDVPKILVPIRGKTILEWQLECLRQRNLGRIILSLGYMADKVIEFINRKSIKDVFWFVEDKPLGTGGAIPLIHERFNLTSPFFVINGDTVLRVDYRKCLAFHWERNSDITVIVKREEGLKDIGSVELDEDSRVLSFEEKVGNKSSFINAGCYCFTFSRVKELFNKDYLSIECDIIPLAVKSGKRVYGFEITKGFYDFGTIEKIRKYAALIDK